MKYIPKCDERKELDERLKYGFIHVFEDYYYSNKSKCLRCFGDDVNCIDYLVGQPRADKVMEKEDGRWKDFCRSKAIKKILQKVWGSIPANNKKV